MEEINPSRGWMDSGRPALDPRSPPLATFRWEIEEAIDLRRSGSCGNEYAQPQGSEAEIKLSPAHVVTLRDGRIIHAETYPHRADALKALGLAE